MDAVERISTFALVPVSWPAESAHRAVNFFDYLIDGVPLRDIVPTQDIGVLGFDPYDEFTQLMAQQLLPPVASIDGRLHGMAQIYGCRECCDLDCGAVIVRISRQGNAIRWIVSQRVVYEFGRPVG